MIEKKGMGIPELQAKLQHHKVQYAQAERAGHAATEDGIQLVSYLSHIRRETAEQRAKADPEDTRWNTVLYGRIQMLDRIIQDWENPGVAKRYVSSLIESSQKALDNAVKNDNLRKERVGNA